MTATSTFERHKKVDGLVQTLSSPSPENSNSNNVVSIFTRSQIVSMMAPSNSTTTRFQTFFIFWTILWNVILFPFSIIYHYAWAARHNVNSDEEIDIEANVVPDTTNTNTQATTSVIRTLFNFQIPGVSSGNVNRGEEMLDLYPTLGGLSTPGFHTGAQITILANETITPKTQAEVLAQALERYGPKPTEAIAGERESITSTSTSANLETSSSSEFELDGNEGSGGEESITSCETGQTFSEKISGNENEDVHDAESINSMDSCNSFYTCTEGYDYDL